MEQKHYDVGFWECGLAAIMAALPPIMHWKKTIEKLWKDGADGSQAKAWGRGSPDEGTAFHPVCRRTLRHQQVLSCFRDWRAEYPVCDAFVLGSDQLWNYGVTKIFGHSYFLDFAGEDKENCLCHLFLAAAVSRHPGRSRKKAVACMQKMDAVSVREADGVKVCRNLFGVRAEHVLDPVLMSDPSILSDLAEKSKRRKKLPHCLLYSGPRCKKREALLYVSKKLDKKLVNMLDGWYLKFPENKKKSWGLTTCLRSFRKRSGCGTSSTATLWITDSFHGTCMAVLFHKPFIAIGNPERGTSRFESLLGFLESEWTVRRAGRADSGKAGTSGSGGL